MYKLCLFRPFVRQFAIVFVSNLGILLIGLEVAWLSPVLVKLRSTNETVLPELITEKDAAWIVSAACGTAIFAIPCIRYLMDRIGRRWCLLISFFPRILSTLLSLFATKFWMVLVGRMLCGSSQALSLIVVPAYNSEIASKDKRGSLGTMTQILSSVGMVITFTTGPFVSYQTLNIIVTGIVVLSFIPHLFLPESPFYLYAQGRSDECQKLLISLRGSSELAAEEMKDYAVTAATTVQPSFIELLKDIVFLKSLGKAMFLAAGFQLVGYNAVTSYLQIIFESTKTDIGPEVSSLIIGVTQLFACITTTIFLADRFGRKPILSVTLLGMACGLIGLGVFFKLSENNYEISGFLNYLPLLSLIMVIVCFNAGMGSMMFLVITELFDGPSRATGMSISVLTTTILMFFTMNFFTSIIKVIGSSATYWVMSGNCVIISLFVVYCLPETKGRSFLEIQQAMGRAVAR